MYLVGHLELLGLADVGGLGDGGLEPIEGLVVQLLQRIISHSVFMMLTDLSRCTSPGRCIDPPRTASFTQKVFPAKNNELE